MEGTFDAFASDIVRFADGPVSLFGLGDSLEMLPARSESLGQHMHSNDHMRILSY